MAYDEQLARRVEQFLDARTSIVSKKMFGGLVFMLDGNMSVGIHRDRLMVRVGPEGYEAALARPHCLPMDITGRPMRGFVVVTLEGIPTDGELGEWVQLGINFASSLPAK